MSNKLKSFNKLVDYAKLFNNSIAPLSARSEAINTINICDASMFKSITISRNLIKKTINCKALHNQLDDAKLIQQPLCNLASIYESVLLFIKLYSDEFGCEYINRDNSIINKYDYYIVIDEDKNKTYLQYCKNQRSTDIVYINIATVRDDNIVNLISVAHDVICDMWASVRALTNECASIVQESLQLLTSNNTTVCTVKQDKHNEVLLQLYQYQLRLIDILSQPLIENTDLDDIGAAIDFSATIPRDIAYDIVGKYLNLQLIEGNLSDEYAVLANCEVADDLWLEQ